MLFKDLDRAAWTLNCPNRLAYSHEATRSKHTHRQQRDDTGGSIAGVSHDLAKARGILNHWLIQVAAIFLRTV